MENRKVPELKSCNRAVVLLIYNLHNVPLDLLVSEDYSLYTGTKQHHTGHVWGEICQGILCAEQLNQALW